MAEFIPDAQQKQAIEHVNGPMLVVAGAGTGKTTVLVERIVNLVSKCHIGTNEILAVTFTTNAAGELRERVAEKLGVQVAGEIQARTFHSYCSDLLKRTGREFTPLSKEDLYVLLRRDLKTLGLKYYIKAARPGEFLDALLSFFDRCEDELVTPARYRAYVEELKAGKHKLPRVLKERDAERLKPEEVIERCEEIAGVFTAVSHMLKEKGLGTYGQQISRAVELLESDSDLLISERRRARFILIDEFQDSNVAQIRLAKLLAGDEQNVFAVGDPDQAIYRFRGATTGAFDHFEKTFKDVKHVSLDRNRRSLSPILGCAFRVISQNPAILRSGGTQRNPLISAREEADPALKGRPVELVYTPLQFSDDTEAVELADAIEKLHSNCAWKDIAVLYRTHRHREELAAELSHRNIPVDVKGVNVLETPEVRDALAAVRAIADPGDSAALFRVAALTRFGINADELRFALRGAKNEAGLVPVLERVKGGPVLLASLARARELAAQSGSKALSTLEIAMEEFGVAITAATNALREFLIEWAKKPITTEASVSELLKYMKYFAEAGGKITLPELGTDGGRDAVQFMSVHAAKGLEFPHVFIIRATTPSFPANYRENLFEFPQALRDPLSAVEGEIKELHRQEERRLFYVAMTRAKDTLTICGKRSRSKKPALPPMFMEATPPGFIKEFVSDKTLRDSCLPRLAEFRPEIEAATTVQAYSSVGGWMLLPPSRPLDKLSLSATQIETYDTCPLRFKIETDWNIPGEPVPAMQFGNAVHTALKGYYDAVQVGRPLSREQFVRIFEEQMEISPFEELHQKQLYIEQGQRQLGEFYDLRNREPQPEVIATEKSFAFELAGVKVIGRIDRVDRLPGGAIRIIDYKTGSPRDEEDAEKSLQLSIYALASQELWQQTPQSIAFYNLENNQPAATTRDDGQLEETKRKIAYVADAIRANEFAPQTGYHCKWCGYRELCPVHEEPLWITEEAIPANAGN